MRFKKGNNMPLLSNEQKTLFKTMTMQGEVIEKLNANFDKIELCSK